MQLSLTLFEDRDSKAGCDPAAETHCGSHAHTHAHMHTHTHTRTPMHVHTHTITNGLCCSVEAAGATTQVRSRHIYSMVLNHETMLPEG